MSDKDHEVEEKKMKAKWAVDTILQAEQHKKDKELAPHIKAELKERAKHLDSAMGKKAEPKAAPKKKTASKKKK
jgi:hypothetical protein